MAEDGDMQSQVCRGTGFPKDTVLTAIIAQSSMEWMTVPGAIQNEDTGLGKKCRVPDNVTPLNATLTEGM